MLNGQLLHRHRATVAVILLISLLGLYSVPESGLMWDEALHAEVPHLHYSLIREAKPLPFDLQYYGTLIDVAGRLLYSISSPLLGPLQSESQSSELRMIRAMILGHEHVADPRFYLLKHSMVFLCSLMAYLAAACFVGILSTPRLAWLGPILLALMPRFWGHSQFNPKDAPFAAAMTLSCLLAALFLDRCFSDAEGPRIGKNTCFGVGLLLAIAIGLTTSIRAGGIALFGFVGLSHLTLLLRRKESRHIQFLIRSGLIYLPLVAVWAAIVYVCHPPAWSTPLTWLQETLQYFSNHAFQGSLRFAGETISTKEVPWFYMPLWLLVSIPAATTAIALCGVLSFLIRFRRLSNLQAASFVLLLFQAFFLLAYAIGKGSTLDAGPRQFLFVMPPIAILAAATIAALFQSLRSRALRAGLALMLIANYSIVALDMRSLGPYTALYFNRVSQKFFHDPSVNKPLEKQFDTDHLGISLRKAAEWLNSNGSTKAPVYMNGPYHSLALFTRPEFKITHLAHLKGKATPPFYYVSIPREAWADWFGECDIVYQVEARLGTLPLPLSVVRYCPDDS